MNTFIKCSFNGLKLYWRCNSAKRLLFHFTSNLINVFKFIKCIPKPKQEMKYRPRAPFSASYGFGRTSRNGDKKSLTT